MQQPCVQKVHVWMDGKLYLWEDISPIKYPCAQCKAVASILGVCCRHECHQLVLVRKEFRPCFRILDSNVKMQKNNLLSRLRCSARNAHHMDFSGNPLSWETLVGHTSWNRWSESVLESDKENLRRFIDSENERKIGEQSRRERERKRFCEGGRKWSGKEKGLSIYVPEDCTI
jgi:hypothetical protein